MRNGFANCLWLVTWSRVTLSVSCVMAAIEAGIVAVGRIWIRSFCCVISTDIDTSAITVVCRSIHVALIVYHSAVISFQVTVIMVVVMSANCLTIRLSVLCWANVIALIIEKKFGFWTLVVAISMSIVSTVTVTFRLVIHQSHKSVALAINGMISAVELFIVAKCSGFALCAKCGVESTDVSASWGCVSWIYVWIAFLIDDIWTDNVVLWAVVVAIAIC